MARVMAASMFSCGSLSSRVLDAAKKTTRRSPRSASAANRKLSSLNQSIISSVVELFDMMTMLLCSVCTFLIAALKVILCFSCKYYLVLQIACLSKY